MRFRSADELMTALLSFQFDASRRHREHVRGLWTKVIGLGGLLVALGVLALFLCRMVVLLNSR